MIQCCLVLTKEEFQKETGMVKVKNFPVATIDDMYGYIKTVKNYQLLKKCPDNIILHAGLTTRLMCHPK